MVYFIVLMGVSKFAFAIAFAFVATGPKDALF